MSDPRGFRYALQTALQRQRWQLDEHRHELAEAQRQHHAAVAEWQRLQDLQRASIQAVAGGRLDPVRAHAHLGYLCQLGERIALKAAECQTLQRRCGDARRACGEAQLRLEAIEDHRDRTRAQFALIQSRIQAAIADQEWTAHRQQGGSPKAGRVT